MPGTRHSPSYSPPKSLLFRMLQGVPDILERSALSFQPFGIAAHGEVILDRDSLSDMVQMRGLPGAIRHVARCRAEAIEALDELYRQAVIAGRCPDPVTSRVLIDRLRSIGATSAVFQACRLLTDLRLTDIRASLFAIIATALISCEQAMDYLRSLENGLHELAAVGVGDHDGWNDACENADGSVLYVAH